MSGGTFGMGGGILSDDTGLMQVTQAMMRSCTFLGIWVPSPTQTFCILSAPSREPNACGEAILAISGRVVSLGSVKEVPDLFPGAKVSTSDNFGY